MAGLRFGSLGQAECSPVIPKGHVSPFCTPGKGRLGTQAQGDDRLAIGR